MNLANSLSSKKIDGRVTNTAIVTIVCKLKAEMSLATLITKGADGNEYVITVEEKRRAKETIKLHEILSHPGEEYYLTRLENGANLIWPLYCMPEGEAYKAQSPAKITLHREIVREP